MNYLIGIYLISASLAYFFIRNELKKSKTKDADVIELLMVITPLLNTTVTIMFIIVHVTDYLISKIQPIIKNINLRKFFRL